MQCVIIKNKEITNYSNIFQLLKSGVESLFVIDYDAIYKKHLNFNLYEKLSKFFELTIMNYPETTGDLMDTIINGATNVIINDNLTYRRIEEFISFTPNIAMNYNYNDSCIYFSENGGEMFLTGKQILLPYKTAFNYNSFNIPNEIKLEGFPPDLER